MDRLWLEESKITELRDIINHEMPYHFDPNFQTAHMAICVMMDRCEDSVRWLNAHSDFVDNEDALLLFLVHGDIVKRTVKKAIDKLGVNDRFVKETGKTEYKYLSRHCTKSPFQITEANLPKDDIVWSYLRALAFAHTEETGAGIYSGYFLEKGERQYSPFVKIDKWDKSVGVVVYSSKWRDTNEFMLPFDALKNYIASWFSGVCHIINEANLTVAKHKKALLKEEIDESGGALVTLQIMRQKYAERYGEECSSDFDFPIMCLSCPLTHTGNANVVSAFRSELERVIPFAVAAFRKLDYNSCLKALKEVYDPPLRDDFQKNSYYLGKVFTHLERGDDQRSIAVMCARDLANKIARDYVKIDVDRMSDDEIKLLFTVAAWCSSRNLTTKVNKAKNDQH